MESGSDDRASHPIIRARQQISGYQLVKRIGRGGVAEVWEALSPAGYRVALKLVHLSSDLRSGELRALEITRGIRHPSLLVILGTWQFENLLVIAMEMADRSLWDRFLEANIQGLRGIPRTELLGYLDSVADAIDYLNEYKHSIAGRHGLGIQHRDLKPQNILLVGKRAKVADFGLARVMERAVTSHTGPCTLPYAAPEYFGGKTSRQSDQYALAVTYCQLRGGQMPFLGTSAQITFGHLCNAPNLEGLPAPERPLVTKALAKRPEDRWADCRAFIAALRALGADQECPVPEALPRQEQSPGAGTAEASGLVASSSSALVSADSDFTPIDTGHLGSALALFTSRLRSAGLLAGRIGSETAARVGSSLSSADGTGPRVAWAAAVRSQWAHVRRGATRAAQGLSSLTHRVRILIQRLRLAASARWERAGRGAAWMAAIRARWTRIRRGAALVTSSLCRISWRWAGPERIWQGAAFVVIGLVVLAAGVWFQTHRGRASATPSNRAAAPIASQEPEARRAAGQPRLLTRAGMTTALVPPPVKSEKKSPEAVAAVVEPVPDTPSTTRPSGAGGSRTADASPSLSPPGLAPNEEKTATGARVLATPGADETPARVARPKEEASLPLEVAAGSEKPASETRIDPAKQPPFLLLEDSGPEGPDVMAARETSVDAAQKATSPAAPASVPRSTKPDPAGDLPRTGTTVKVLPRTQGTVAYERGRSDLARGEYAKAVADFTEAIWLGGDWFEALLQRGVAYNLEGRLEEALADYDEAIRLQPKNAEVYLLRAKAHCDLGETRLGLQDYSEAIRLRGDAKAYIARGRLHHEMGFYDQALADFEAALRFRSDDTAARFHLGLTRYVMGDNANAVQDFTEVIRLDPQHASAYRLRGDAFARLGDYAHAGADHEAYERLSHPSGGRVLK
jgi:serine/threonine protein kinase/Flp pilus assembly protein TadD